MRSYSAVRVKPKGSSPASGQGRGLTSSVSLPSLVPSKSEKTSYGFPSVSDKALRKAPSELLLERQEIGFVQGDSLQPKITAFLDLSQYSNYTNPRVPVDQPLFSVHPPVVAWTDFEGLQTYEATVTLRNRDSVARRVKVCPPDSRIFELAPGRGRGRSRMASTSGAGDKVAPGMEVTYIVRFKPDARIDYSYDLVVITEREKFNVPLRACGGSALLEFPDTIDFGPDNVVGHAHERSVLVRNVGDRPAKFIIRTVPPFSVNPPLDYLPVGAATHVSVKFKPEGVEPYERDLHLKYGGMEACCTLLGSAYNAEISMSDSLLEIDDTYVGLFTQNIVTIRNDSDVPIDFSWRLFPSTIEERSYRGALYGQLKQEQRDETLYMQQCPNSDDDSDDSCSDEERLRARRDMKVSSGLGRKYGNLTKAIDEDLMLFNDDNFRIEPLQGTIWSHSQLTCMCSFQPTDALTYSCTAYLASVGQEERAPLVLKGHGIGPKAAFSYDELDVNDVFVESAHRYQVQLFNQGEIEVKFQLERKDTEWHKQFKFTPEFGEIAVGDKCDITVDFKPTQLGPFEVLFEWTLKGSAKAVQLKYSGCSIEPTFKFDEDKLNFGVVSFGFLNSRMLTLTNTSEVPIVYTMNIPDDIAAPNNEFTIIPTRGTLLPSCQQRIQVDFVSLTQKRYELDMVVDIDGVKAEEVRKIPITAQCATPQVSFEPHGKLDYGDIFTRYPFHASLYIHNTSSLPAKFEVMPQDDPSRAAFEPDQWSGSVPPCASHVITVTLTAHEPGPVQIPMYVKIIGRSVPFPLVLVANSIGPRVVVEPAVKDWGAVRCGMPVVEHIRLTNNSCIDASVRAFMNEKNSLWTVRPKVIHLSPQETLQLAVTLTIDETLPMQDTLNLIVAEGEPHTVLLKGRGTHSPIECDQDLEFINFGLIFTTRHEPIEVVIRNKGQLGRRITWFREKEKTKDKDKAQEALKDMPGRRGKGKEPEPKPFVFRVEPDNVIIEPRTAYRFTFYAMSMEKGVFEDTICCNEMVDKGGGPGKVLYKTRLRAEFVAPVLRLLDGQTLKPVHEMLFQFNWERNKRVKPITKTIVLQNPGPLDVAYKIHTQEPFKVDGEIAIVPSNGSQSVEVEFDPSYKDDRKSAQMNCRLVVQYEDHEGSNTLYLIGRVCWPNLELEDSKRELDFGYVLEETAKQLELKMHNPTALTVAFDWTIAAATNASEGNSGDGGNLGSVVSLSTGGPGNASDEFIDINQIFDVLPIFGKIEPGETQVAKFTYYAMKDKHFRAVATCFVDGGPEYEVLIKGSAATCSYELNKTELDFGRIPFTEVGERELVLTNPSKVPAAFFFNMQSISRNSVDIVPSAGTLHPDRPVRASVKFRAGIPDQVTETVLVEVAHFEPTRLTVSGCGTFPGIVLGLPRGNEAEHANSLDEARKRLRGRRHVELPAGFNTETMSASACTDAGVSSPPPVVDATSSVVKFSRAPVQELGPIDAVIPKDSVGGLASHRTLDSEAVQAAETMNPKHAGQKRLANLDLELEFEVDRHYLCEELLRVHGVDASGEAKAGSTSTPSMRRNATFSQTVSTMRPRKHEPPAVTAAQYVCDFGHIALGQTRTEKFMVYNCCTEPVMVTIDKKTLKEAGFIVDPEQMKQLLPKKSTVLAVTASRPREENEGKVELEWNLPVKGGPNYRIQLIADFVLPDLNLSAEFLDFGKIVVGQRKRMVVEFHNTKAVPVDWSYPEPNDRHGKRLGSDPLVFDMQPSSGTLMPGERKQIFVYFAPRTASQSTASLQLKLRDNPARKKITVVGRGDVMRLEVRPSLTYELGPIMPNQSGASREFVLYNPTDYALEVYSTDFDEKYIEEERMVAEFMELAKDEPWELPLRLPGDNTWKSVRRRVSAARKERRELEKAERAAAQLAAREAAALAARDGGGQDEEQHDGGEEGGEDAVRRTLTEITAEQKEKEENEEEEEDISDGPDETEEILDHSQYPWRVPTGKRVSTLIIGPPKSGMTTLSRRLAKEDLRKVLSIDEAVEWATMDPRYLRPDRTAKRIREKILAGIPVAIAEVAHLLKRRIELMDCNAGIIVDGVDSKYLPDPRDATEAVLEALRAEKVTVMAIRLTNETSSQEQADDRSSVHAEAAPQSSALRPGDAPDVRTETAPPSACKALASHYDELIKILYEFADHLRGTKIPQLETSVNAAEKALKSSEIAAEAATKALKEVKAAMKQVAELPEPEGDEQALAAAKMAKQEAEDKFKETWPEAKAAKKEADEKLAEAAAAYKNVKADLEEAVYQLDSASKAYAWKQEKPPEEEAPVVPEPEPKKAAKKTGKKKDDGVTAEQLAEIQEREKQKLAAFTVAKYFEMYDAVRGAVEKYNDKARKDEEDRQGEIERKRRARQEATKKNSRAGPARSSSRGKQSVEPKLGIRESPQYLTAMEKWIEPITFTGLPLVLPPFDELPQEARPFIPMPEIPSEMPLPHPTVVQILEPPPVQTNRPLRPENFTILTPVRAPLTAAARQPSKEKASADSDPALESEAPSEEIIEGQTRWIIEPQSELHLLVHFNVQDSPTAVGNYSHTLGFEMVDDATRTLTQIYVSGAAELPGINSDPRIIFPRPPKAKRPPNGYHTKAFVASLNVYDYGPLLVGRNPSCRHPQIKEVSDDGADDTDDPDGTGGGEREERVEKVSKDILRHAESIKILNNSLFPANVTLGLASAEDPNSEEVSPFIIDRDQLQLDVEEEAIVKVWCFPQQTREFNDQLIARIEHNPEPVQFGLCAVGAMPAVILEQTEVDFGRMMMNIRADDHRVRLKNETMLPAKWQFTCFETKIVYADGTVEEAVRQPPWGSTPPTDAEVKGKGKGAAIVQEVHVRYPEEFFVECMEGTLQPGEVKDVRLGFRATKAATFNFALGLEARDDQNFSAWKVASDLRVRAETFAVDIEVVPDPTDNILDFGTVLVNRSESRTFDVVNRGRFPVKYELKVRSRKLNELLHIDCPKGELQPSEKKTIEVTCKPKHVIDNLNDAGGIIIHIKDSESLEAVAHGIPPIRVNVAAVFNSFLVTPPRGVNFGPVAEEGVQDRSFVLRNTGIFPFDWMLLDFFNPPTFAQDGRPEKPPEKMQIQPFTVSPTFGNLAPDEDIEVKVEFKASGDKDYDSKISIWVDGVQGAESATGGSDDKPPPMMAGSGVTGNIPGTSTYLLTGQSCIPGINTKDLQTIFEEQFFARTLEDAIAIAGRSDVTIFSEVDRILHFGPVLTASDSVGDDGKSGSDGVTERLRLTNPKAIPCDVELTVEPRADLKGGGDEDMPFSVKTQKVTIPPHGFTHVDVRFRPTKLANFGAYLEARVPAGRDEQTNRLKFELRGDGAVPSVKLHGPRLEGEEGRTLHLGRLALGKVHDVRMALSNAGLLPATVHVDFTPSPHFSTTCPQSMALNKGEQRPFSLSFHPRREGPLQGTLHIKTVGNAFESVPIDLTGEGFSDEVAWDFTEMARPGGAVGARTDEEPSDRAAPPSPDELNLGEVTLGTEKQLTFHLTNTLKETLRFQFPAAMPAPFGDQLVLDPTSGFVEPGGRAPINLTFKPTAKVEVLEHVLVMCQIATVAFEGEPPLDPEAEQPFNVLEDLPGMSLKLLGKADDRDLQCEHTEIAFAPTVMFATRRFCFKLTNRSTIGAAYEWRVTGRNASAYTVTPQSGTVPPQGESEIEVRFSPLEVENFDAQLFGIVPGLDEALFRILLSGSALRPWCHIELPPCDYRSRRQADTPLDPKYNVAEISSLGTHVKNTKRFYVYNPTGERIEFRWERDNPSSEFLRPDSTDDDPFRCLTRKGSILPSKKFEMVFEYNPQTNDAKESFWKFMLLGPQVEMHFLLVGTVEEPRIGMDVPCVNFGERLLDGVSTEKVRLVNKEHIPFSFSFDMATFQIEGQPQALAISPTSGVVGPDSNQEIMVTFKPVEEGPFNFNVVCTVKRKKEPLVLNVKGKGYKIRASLEIDEPIGRRAVNVGVLDSLDFGMLQVHEKRTIDMYLRNTSTRNFNYRVMMQTGRSRKPRLLSGGDRAPPYLSVTQSEGLAETGVDTQLALTYSPCDAHSLSDTTLQVVIPAGPKDDVFAIRLAGGAKRSRVEFSFIKHDFGPCFIAKGGATMAGEPFETSEDSRYECVDLIATNRDDMDCMLMTTFQRQPWLDVKLNAEMIEAGGSVRIPIVFSPREVTAYNEIIDFFVNDYTRTRVEISGRGCPLRLELTDLDMQNVDFGVTTGGESVTRQVRVINRSQRPVTFELNDPKGDLQADKAVFWNPASPTLLRPRDTCNIDLRFAPGHRIASFKQPLFARCDHGVEVRLLQVSGTCHATEMRLSEHSVAFGDVVVGSQATRVVRLHNFGDLGSRFRFDVPARYRGIMSVQPTEGFVRPQEEITLNVAFHPSVERIAEYRRHADRKNGAKRSPAAAGSGEVSIAAKDIRCVLDGHAPLFLEATGRCILQPGESSTLQFATEVRTRMCKNIQVENRTDAPWRLRPAVQTTEPEGQSFWSCQAEVQVPAGSTKEVEVWYAPLTMTAAPNAHRGSLFIGTPDGAAISYTLEGTALQPKVDKRLKDQVPCKCNFPKRIAVKNWLYERQRFDVQYELVEPDPSSQAGQGINLKGINTLDLPPGMEREYTLSIYAYHEGTALVRVTFNSKDTGEFLVVEIDLEFQEAKSLGQITLQGTCRQLVRHNIAVTNPFHDRPARFVGSCAKMPDIRFNPASIEVPPREEKTMELLFRPVEVGSGTVEAILTSEELGTYPYTINWSATPAGLERTLVLKAPLGGSRVENFRFMHYARQQVTYTAVVSRGSEAKGLFEDFTVETPQVTGNFSGDEGSETHASIRFQPSALGECKALLTVSGPGGGEYKALLVGYAEDPSPLGPFNVQNGKATPFPFRNPFTTPVLFALHVNNAAFKVPDRQMTIPAQTTVQITVSFQSQPDQSNVGTLKVSCENFKTGWTIFLNGTM